MAERDRVDQKRQADRRAALLALAAAAKGAPESDCLTDDNLACLVEHQCTAGEQKQYLSHLAGCETCYRRWLELTEAVQEQEGIQQKKAGNIQQLFRPKPLAWAGSMLAAAASVVLFLNISGRINVTVPLSKTETASETSYRGQSLPEAQSIEQPAAPSMSAVNNMEDTIDEAEPKKERVAAPVPETEKEVLGSGQFSSADEPAKSVMPQTTAWQKLSMDDGGAEETIVPTVDDTSLQADAWFAELRQACLAGEKNSQFWQQAYLQGKEIVRGNKAEREDLVRELLSMVQGVQQSPASGEVICRQILERLQ